MRRFLVGLLAVVALAACSDDNKVAEPAVTTTTSIPAPAGLETLTVDPAAAQTIDAFGASGAWWPNDLVNFPEDVRNRVGDMLFSPEGIALSGYRYNIGGGGEGVTNPVRATPAFRDDDGGRLFLEMARDAKVPKLTAFVNSAVPEFTTNSETCGGALKPGSEADYAAYLANIVKELAGDGTTINYVSAMNEPDDSFEDCGQEGMIVPVGQRAAVVQAVGKALAGDAPEAKVIADESASTITFAAQVPQWLDTPDTKQYLAALAHHTYDVPNLDMWRTITPVSERFDLPTWMTEICCYKGSGGPLEGIGAQYDPTMTQAMWLANDINHALSVAGDGAYYWWTALSPVIGCEVKADPTCPSKVNTKGFNDGLLYYDENYKTTNITELFPSKRYYAFGQFSRFVRPGTVRHEISTVKGVTAMAFENDGEWTVVAWNEGNAPAPVGIALPKGEDAIPVTATQTNDRENLTQAALPARTSAGSWLATIAPNTIVTYVFK